MIDVNFDALPKRIRRRTNGSFYADKTETEQPDSEDDVKFVLHYAYDSDEPEFVRGAEVGALEVKIGLLGTVVIQEVMRQTNTEMVRRIAEAAGRNYITEIIDDTWMHVTIEPIVPDDD